MLCAYELTFAIARLNIGCVTPSREARPRGSLASLTVVPYWPAPGAPVVGFRALIHRRRVVRDGPASLGLEHRKGVGQEDDERDCQGLYCFIFRTAADGGRFSRRNGPRVKG